MIYTMGGVDDAPHRKAISEWPKSGSSLACRFRFEANEVYIRQDPATEMSSCRGGRNSWESFFKLTEQQVCPRISCPIVRNGAPQKRELFR